jgi:phage terminase large subunit
VKTSSQSVSKARTELRPPETTNVWPVDVTAIYAWRQQQVQLIRSDPRLAYGAKVYYRTHPVQFVNHWCDTYDPRRAGKGSTKLPLILFQRQEELVEFLLACVTETEPGLIEKSRDMGATWVASAFSVWLWLFWPGVAVGWGSRKEQLVDKLGDPDSIFEKIRMLIHGLPEFFLPDGFSPSDHMTFMRIINPANGATITGEAGDNIGRGGRKLIYFKDESSHYERPEKIEAALSDTTRVPIDISSVNGIGNVFHRKRESGADWNGVVIKGKTQVFVMDWRDHPDKNQSWYDTRKARAEEEGLQHIFAQEVDRNYAASVDGALIQQEWVQAAIDAHLKLELNDSGPWSSALDVADSGSDTNAQSQRQGIILRALDEWGARDTAQTARRAIANVTKRGRLDLQYDCIGVGAGVKGEVNNLRDENLMPNGIRFVPWNAGGKVLNPKKRVIPGDKQSPLNEEFYTNLKAQGWWELRNRFYRTWRSIHEGAHYDPDSLISIDSRIKNLRKLEKELCQVTASKGARLKLVIDKTPDGTKSPNLADAVMMDYWPMRSGYDLAKFMGD